MITIITTVTDTEAATIATELLIAVVIKREVLIMYNSVGWGKELTNTPSNKHKQSL